MFLVMKKTYQQSQEMLIFSLVYSNAAHFSQGSRNSHFAIDLKIYIIHFVRFASVGFL